MSDTTYESVGENVDISELTGEVSDGEDFYAKKD